MEILSLVAVVHLLLSTAASAPVITVSDPSFRSSSSSYTYSPDPAAVQQPISRDWDESAQTLMQGRIPTRYESTVLGRRLMALSRHASISTVFPHQISSGRVPQSVHDSPIALPEYIASCEEPSGNPTILALKVSTSTQNAVAGSNVSLAISWWDEYVNLVHKEPWSYANLPRLSLIGYLEEMSADDVQRNDIVECFTHKHADARWWLPGDKASPHAGVWMRLVVEQVYWIGGFGDRAFIGWFDPDEWRGVERDEWQAVRLPGER